MHTEADLYATARHLSGADAARKGALRSLLYGAGAIVAPVLIGPRAADLEWAMTVITWLGYVLVVAAPILFVTSIVSPMVLLRRWERTGNPRAAALAASEEHLGRIQEAIRKMRAE